MTGTTLSTTMSVACLSLNPYFPITDPAYEPPEYEFRATLSDVYSSSGSVLLETPPAPSGWLQSQWLLAKRDHRDAVWGGLPESVLEFLQEHSLLVSAADIAFLAHIASDPATRSPSEIRAAIRLLGGIGEDEFARRETVVPHLLHLLSSGHPDVRTAATEAIWQIGDKATTPALRSAFERETHPHARLTMEHVLRVFS